MKYLKILLLLAFFLSPVFSTAQAWEANPAEVAEKRERVHSLILMRLTQRLGLSSADANKLGQIMKKYQGIKINLKNQLRDQSNQLRSVSAGGNEAEIEKVLSQVNTTRQKIDQVDDQMFNELKSVLNPKQQAQFLIVMEEIRGEVRAIRRQPSTAGSAR